MFPWMQARAFAIRVHGAQLYGDKPYAHHLASVAAVTRDFTDSGTMLAAAWLHDTLEDTSTTQSEIAALFGVRVAKIVYACTGEGLTRAERMRRIYDRIADCREAALVKTADRIANVEACDEAGTKMAMYRLEADRFHARVAYYAPAGMRRRLEAAYRL